MTRHAAPQAMSLKRVFVANRGEIAARIERACIGLGIECVLPELPSFLDGPAVIAAALESGADSIHPGYGFLSENAEFARAVVAAGLVWIGPRAETIELMGRKDRARTVAQRAGVPVTPRFDPDTVPDDAYPVLVKAAAGGGGKGMHIVWEASALPAALATAAREAASAFGDDTLLIEKYVEGGKHVEVQVFGDSHGNVVHLFERDCSAQRRHQKVLEEAPAPYLSAELRRTLLDAAVALSREVGYENAGTVEFLVEPGREVGPAGVPGSGREDGSAGVPGSGREVGSAGVPGSGREESSAFFLEMNTRLQVEHPVTEEVTGIDLVKWQLAVAAGEPLPRTQAEITCTGHAIEARIYAEDPYAGFLPQAGRIVGVAWPDGARVESAVRGPTTVTTAFDPMLAKVIAVGADREGAIDALVDALSETGVFGITTNTGFVRRLADSADFREGRVHTGWLDGHDGDLMQRPVASDTLARAGAALVWPEVGDGWRSAGPVASTSVTVLIDGEKRRVEANASAALFVAQGPRAWLVEDGHVHVVERPDGMRRARVASAGDAEVIAPMPGTVLAVDVEVGSVVEAGDRLGVLEAMKMELPLVAAHAGTVTEVGAVAGAQVTMGHLLFHVEPT